MVFNVHKNPTVGIDDEEMFFQFLRAGALQSNYFDIVSTENLNKMILIEEK